MLTSSQVRPRIDCVILMTDEFHVASNTSFVPPAFSIQVRTRTATETNEGLTSPIFDVVTRFPARLGEIRDFIVTITLAFELMDGFEVVLCNQLFIRYCRVGRSLTTPVLSLCALA